MPLRLFIPLDNVAHHAAVEETNAWDDIRFGTTSIEHWYGIPDAAIEAGAQNFPPSYNYNEEVDRFRYAGRRWREADPVRLTKVLDAMGKTNVAWDPALDIYEASRDLQRAQTQPWFTEVSSPVARRVFQTEPGQSRLVLSGLDFHGRGVLERILPPLDGCAAAVRSTRRTHRNGR